MSGAINGHPPGYGGRRSFMDLANTLGRDEILEILSGGLCAHCEGVLQTRFENLTQNNSRYTSSSAVNGKAGITELCSVDSSDVTSSSYNGVRSNTNRAKKFVSDSSSQSDSEITETKDLFWGNSSDCVSSDRRLDSPSPPPGNPRGIQSSYLNHFMKANPDLSSSPASINSKQKPVSKPYIDICLNDGLSRREASLDDKGLSEEQKEHIRLAQVKRKKDFVHYERVEGRRVNVLEGLELHSQVFNAAEQLEIVESVYKLQRMGQRGQLRERTYTEPRKWMRGKGRATIQFGCCYNYAVDKKGNPPGILREEEVDPLPPIFKQMIKRMVKFHVLPRTCVPNSCIVNIYDEGDCIPPHIDHHDFLRPFCTVSFLSECNILFGSSLKIVSPGEFSGPVSIPLPVGSVLILQGNGADVAKHCVPAVPAKRISVTFRKMDERKVPYCFRPDPELSKVLPLVHRPPPKEPSPDPELSKVLPLVHRPPPKEPSPDPELSKVAPLVHRPPPKEPSRGISGGYQRVGPAQNNLGSSEEYPPLGSFSSSNRHTSGKTGRS